jgi:sulfite reductase (NADPH) flavoprotein alpha-component
MSAHDLPEGAALIPEDAPFTPEQRSWLSGFLTAVLMAPPPAAEAPGGPAGAPAPGPTLASNDEAPWHDPAMALADRMQLADSKPLAPRLMAAMAQQDCGQCGYNCADYANALFARNEKRLNLCAPGGKDTQRMLKALAVEFDSPAEARALAPSIGGNLGAALETMPASTDLALPGRSRDRPVAAIFRDRRLLNARGSEKQVWHIEFDLAGSSLDYAVGDSFGIFPANDLGLVDQIIAMLGVSHETPVRGRPLRRALAEDFSLGQAPDALFELFRSFWAEMTAPKPARWRAAKIPMAMRRISMCSPFCRSFRRRAPILKSSSKRSNPCSRVFTRFHPRRSMNRGVSR